jgi:polyhydroxyalkanoate synthesis regulator phasin
MAASKSSNRSGGTRGARSKAGSRAQSSATPGARRPSGGRTRAASSAKRGATGSKQRTGVVADGLASLAEQLTNRIIKPLGLVVLTRERIQETLDEAAERGRLTRTDANELVATLVQRGRQQTDELLSDLERLLGRGRQQLDVATRKARLNEPLERLVRGAERARRSVGGKSSFPIGAYDELTAGQVQDRLGGLGPGELRKVREYERRHANRKSVLTAIEKLLG